MILTRRELQKLFEAVYSNNLCRLREAKVSQVSKRIAGCWKENNYQKTKNGSDRDKYKGITDTIKNLCINAGGTDSNFINDLNGNNQAVGIGLFSVLAIIDAVNLIAEKYNYTDARRNSLYNDFRNEVLPQLREALQISDDVMQIVNNNDSLSVQAVLLQYLATNA